MSRGARSAPIRCSTEPAEDRGEPLRRRTSRPGGPRSRSTAHSPTAPRRPEAGPQTRRRPDSLLGDKGYDSNPHREELRKRRILPVTRRGALNIKGLGELRYVVEQTFALLHQFKRLAVRWERRTELHDAFVSLACGLIR
ncbi:transposase [Streptomyces sp. NBC_00080]|uniref:transposase n=1 Tax=Streptomyces sp. NBC_00080 TaxID=2975645 RepID=UPI00386596A3